MNNKAVMWKKGKRKERNIGVVKKGPGAEPAKMGKAKIGKTGARKKRKSRQAEKREKVQDGLERNDVRKSVEAYRGKITHYQSPRKASTKKIRYPKRGKYRQGGRKENEGKHASGRGEAPVGCQGEHRSDEHGTKKGRIETAGGVCAKKGKRRKN